MTRPRQPALWGAALLVFVVLAAVTLRGTPGASAADGPLLSGGDGITVHRATGPGMGGTEPQRSFVVTPACSSGGADISTGLGLVADSGTPDTIWAVTSGPTTGSAYPISKPVAWVAPPAGTNWIDPNNTPGLTVDPFGTYVYEMTFTVPVGTTVLTLDFDFAVDNNVAMFLDGVAIPGTTLTGDASGNFTGLHSLVRIYGNPASGTHTLTANVESMSGAVGLLVSGTATCLTTPVCSPVLDISTGVGRTPDDGIADALWTVSSGPTTGATYAISKPVAWVAPPAGTNWIDPNNTSALIIDPAGTYVYDASFTVPSGISWLVLQFQFAVDNGVTIDIDGTTIPGTTLAAGPSSNFTTLHPANNHLSYVVVNPSAGPHTLHATVTNSEGPVGFLLAGKASCYSIRVGGIAEAPDSSELGSPAAGYSSGDAMPLAAPVAIAVAIALVSAGTVVWRRRSAR